MVYKIFMCSPSLITSRFLVWPRETSVPPSRSEKRPGLGKYLELGTSIINIKLGTLVPSTERVLRVCVGLGTRLYTKAAL